jgi:hypothetical protein
LPHADVEVPCLAGFLIDFGDEFEGLAYAVLDHLFLCFAEFSKFSRQNLEDLFEARVIPEATCGLERDALLGEFRMPDQVVYYRPASL